MKRIRDIVTTAKKAAKLKKTSYEQEVEKLGAQIEALREKQRKANLKKREFGLISRLTEKGAKDAWQQLPKRRKYEKQNLLAVFSSHDIPQPLIGMNWYKNAPEELKEDRELLIARASTTALAGLDDPFLPSSDFSIPEAFLDDLEVIKAVAKPCPRALAHNGIPPVIFGEDEVFRAFVNRKPILDVDYKEELGCVLAKFGIRIRSNAAFMLEAAKVGLNVFPYLVDGLPSNKEFCLELAKLSNTSKSFTIPADALKYVSDSLKTDRDLVLSFVQENGLALEYAAPIRCQDLEVVCAASDNNPGALVYCSGFIKIRLGGDRAFMNSTLSQVKKGHFPGLYSMLSNDLKSDLDMIVEARERNCFDVADLPKDLLHDPQFWKDALAESSFFWKDLPDKFKLDVSFARYISEFKDVHMVLDVVRVHPELSTNTEFWCGPVLNSSALDEDDFNYILDEIGSGVRNNRDVMLLACSKTDELLQKLSRDFMLDREFVQATVENSSLALFELPFEAQLLYPDLVALAITNFGDYLEDGISSVHPKLWSNLVVAEAWFKSEGPIHDNIPTRLKEDPDYCLLIMEHCWSEADDFVSSSLKSNKEFMMRAVEKNPASYALSCGSLKVDYDLTLASFGAADSDFLVQFMIDTGSNHAFAYLESFLREVQNKLEIHRGLFTLLLGMSAFSGSACQLSMLQQGQETTLTLKRRIAEYLGSPVGGEVVLLRRAAVALQSIPDPLFSPLEVMGILLEARMRDEEMDD